MYIIKIHYVATDANPNFKGQTQDWYEGKGTTALSQNEFPPQWMISEYGYKTLSGAKKGLQAVERNCEFENRYGYWTATAELIQVN